MGDAILEHEPCTAKSHVATTCNDRESCIESGTRHGKDNNYDDDHVITGHEDMSWNEKDSVGIVTHLVH